LSAKQHQRIIDRDARQPGRELGTFIEPAQSSERSDYGILHHIFDVSGVAYDRADRPPGYGRTLLDQFDECSVTAGFASRH